MAWAWLSRWEWDQLPKIEVSVPLRGGERASVTVQPAECSVAGEMDLHQGASLQYAIKVLGWITETTFPLGYPQVGEVDVGLES